MGDRSRFPRPLGDTPSISDIAIQPDGSVILVGGYTTPTGQNTPFIDRFTSQGVTDGTAFASPAGNFAYEAVAVQADGKILVSAFDPSTLDPGPQILRFNANGTLDATFGTGGIVQEQLPASFLGNIAVQPDGKIVAAGYSDDPNGPDDNSVHFLTQRFNTNGSPDASFGSNGQVITALGGNDLSAHRAAIAPDGGIIEVGGIVELAMVKYTGDSAVLPPPPTGGTISGTVYHDVNANGQQDAGEAPVAGRQVYLDLNGIGVFAAGDPVVTTDALGHYSFGNLPAANYLVRLVPQNGLAISAPLFGGKYFVQLSANQTVSGDDFGTIAIASPSFPVNGQLIVSSIVNGDNTLTRYNADGSIDVAFGTLGTVVVGTGATGLASDIRAVTGGIQVTYSNQVLLFDNTGVLQKVTNNGASISGTVFSDINNNAVRDSFEAGLAGRVVNLIGGTGAASALVTTTTDANGNYTFSGLLPANYLVQIVPQAGQAIESPLYGGDYFVQLKSLQTVSGDDFAIQTLAAPTFTTTDLRTIAAPAGFSTSGLNLIAVNPNGTLDPTFGVFGKLALPGSTPQSSVLAFYPRPDGNILVSWATNTGFVITTYLSVVTQHGALLETVQTSSAIENIGSIQQTVTTTPDNKTIVVDRTTNAPLPFSVARYNADLSVDTTFGTGGQVALAGITGQALTGTTVLADGHIVLNFSGVPVVLNSNGTLDTTDAVTIQSDQKILFGGQVNGLASLTRYNADGSLDTSLFSAGTYVTNFQGTVHQILILPNGAYVLWEKATPGLAQGNVTDAMEFLTSAGFDKGRVSIATFSSGNSGTRCRPSIRSSPPTTAPRPTAPPCRPPTASATRFRIP